MLDFIIIVVIHHHHHHHSPTKHTPFWQIGGMESAHSSTQGTCGQSAVQRQG
jgi:acid phosphatase family membrane protein YuiD